MKVRVHGEKKEDADGRDEGGYYKLEDKPDLSPKLKARMARCGGCYYAFYNQRANVGGNHCWSLTDDKNFGGHGTPRCWTRG